MKVMVIGTGKIGLITSCQLSLHGHDVICFDTNAGVIEDLKRGKVRTNEPGLPELVSSAIKGRRLTFTTNIAAAAIGADFVFLTTDGHTNASEVTHLHDTAESVAKFLPKGAIVVINGAVPVGTNRRLAHLLRTTGGRKIDVASKPEMFTDGNLVAEYRNAETIVLGVRNKRVGDALQRLFSSVAQSATPPSSFVITEPESAELSKSTANYTVVMSNRMNSANRLAAVSNLDELELSCFDHEPVLSLPPQHTRTCLPNSRETDFSMNSSSDSLPFTLNLLLRA